MDQSDEGRNYVTACYAEIQTFDCDEFIGSRELWSCGDGEQLAVSSRIPFQTTAHPHLL